MRTDHSPTSPDAGSRRFLIAAAVAHHVHSPQWDRPDVVAARSAIIELFTGTFGYTLVPAPGLNPTETQLLSELDTFCTSPERRPDDIVAIYFTGHGERLNRVDDHVLLTAETHPDRLRLALTTAQLARAILYETPVRRVLLMLDTCYSSKGGNDFTAAALTEYTRHWDETPGNSVVVISSAQPHQTADAAQFPYLLTEAVQSLSTAGHGPETIAAQTLVAKINNLAAETPWQVAGLNEITPTGQAPAFFPNPRHDPRLYEVDLALQQAAQWEANEQRRDEEFRHRLLVRAMGSTDGRGWWFTGRHTALTDITTWLHHPDPTRPLLAVTGNPGSGKTAVLGVIAALTHPDYHRTVPVETLGFPPGTIPEVGALDVPIYAQNLTLARVRDDIADAAGLTANSVGELLDRLAGRAGVLTVLIDGLDEAADPTQLTQKLLRPLIDYGHGRVRLLIGTRPHLLPSLRTDRDHEIDLDAHRYADREAMTTYVVRGLLDNTPDSPYRDQDRGTVRAIAAAVTDAAYPAFLVARIVTTALCAGPNVPDPKDPEWRRSLPALPGDAMRNDLEIRLGADAEKARDLLRPLAFAQGQGLPWEDLWAGLASALADVDYTDHDLIWLRRAAGSYVVEAMESGRSVYRLYHQALAEHLTERCDTRAMHARFVDVLIRRVPVGADGHRIWSRAHPYTLRYLAAHAVHADLVEDLIEDMEFLVHADPTTLPAALHTVGTRAGLGIRAIYLCSAGRHRELSASRRRQILAIDAARFTSENHLRQLNRTLRWRIRWATGAHASPALHDTFVGHGDAVLAVATCELGGTSIAVTTSDDHTARIWDLVTGAEQLTLRGHTRPVNGVALTVAGGRALAVTTSDDHTARMWDLTTGRQLRTFTGHTDAVNGVATAVLDGRAVVVTTGDDHTARVWDLSTGIEKMILRGHTRGVNGVALSTVDGRTVAITVSADNTARMWDLTTGRQVRILAGHTHWVSGVATTSLDGRAVAITTSHDHTARVWDLASGAPLRTLDGHTDPVIGVATAVLEDRVVAVTTSWDDTVRVWDLTTGSVRATLSGHAHRVIGVATTSLRGRLLAVTVSWDATVRLWDLAIGAHLPVRAGHTDWVSGVDVCTLAGRGLIATAGHDTTVRTWDLVTGAELPTLLEHPNLVSGVASTTLDGLPVLVTTGADYLVRVWNSTTGTIRATLTGHTGHTGRVTGVATDVLDGRPIAVTTSHDGSARVWDLTTCTVLTTMTGHALSLTAVATTMLDGRSVAVTTSWDGTAKVWDLATGALHTTFTGHTDRVNAVATTIIDGRPVAVTTSWDRTAQAWDLTSGRRIRKLSGHTDRVCGAAVTTINGHHTVITTSWDHTIRIWELRTGDGLAVIDFPAKSNAVAIGPTGEIIVSFGNDVAVLDHHM
ncbi:caspase family protein [Nocardia takedensis]